MPCGVETRLYLVRHGETDWNREQRLQGALDMPLNSAGVAQAPQADLLDAYGGQSVVVVGHGVTLAAMWCAATGLEIARLQECQPPNAGGVVLTFSQRQLVDARAMTIAEIPV